MLFLAISSVSATEIDDGTTQFEDINILEDNSISQLGDDLNIPQEEINETNNIDNNETTTEDINTTDTNDTDTCQEDNTNINNDIATEGVVTLKQVYDASSTVNNYILKYSILPKFVTVGNYNVTISQFTYLMAYAIKNINDKHTSYKINIIPIMDVSEINGDFIVKNASLSTYGIWVKNVVSKGTASNSIYSYITFSNSKMAFKDYTFVFAKILNFYKNNGRLPNSVLVETLIYTNAPKILLGSNSLGKVEFIGPFGNVNSSIKIAYCIGVHVREYQAHNALYYTLNTKESSLKYGYYVYRITLAKVTGSYSKDRMSGQKLAQKYVLPHASKQNYSLFVDIHSTVGKAYKHSYFVFVPGNKNKQFIKLAKTIVSNTKKMVYYNPPSQTSPKYLTLPLVNKGTPTFVFETLTSESYNTTLSRVTSLINTIDSLFTESGKLKDTKTYVKVSDIVKASKSFKTYIKNHKKKLPSTVKVGSIKVTQAQFVYLMAMAIQKINAKNLNAKIAVIKVATSKKVSYKINKSVKKSSYFTVAKNVAKYIISKKKIPTYATIGKSKAKYTVYATSFANILAYYRTYKRLPYSVKFKS